MRFGHDPRLPGGVRGAWSSLIKERQREGIALAKQRGAYRGRRKALTRPGPTAARLGYVA